MGVINKIHKANDSSFYIYFNNHNNTLFFLHISYLHNGSIGLFAADNDSTVLAYFFK